MRAPNLAFTIALPVLSSLAPVLGVGNAAALPLERRQPDSPKFYFPRHIKRQLGPLPFLNTTLPIVITTTSDEPSPPATKSHSEEPTKTSSGSLDDILSSLLTPSDVPSSTQQDNTHTASDGIHTTVDDTTSILPDPSVDPLPNPSDNPTEPATASETVPSTSESSDGGLLGPITSILPSVSLLPIGSHESSKQVPEPTGSSDVNFPVPSSSADATEIFPTTTSSDLLGLPLTSDLGNIVSDVTSAVPSLPDVTSVVPSITIPDHTSIPDPVSDVTDVTDVTHIAPTPTSKGLLGGLNSDLEGIASDVTSALPSVPLTSDIGSLVSDVTSGAPSIPTTISDVTNAIVPTPTSSGLLGGLPLTSDIGNIVSDVPSAVPSLPDVTSVVPSITLPDHTSIPDPVSDVTGVTDVTHIAPTPTSKGLLGGLNSDLEGIASDVTSGVPSIPLTKTIPDLVSGVTSVIPSVVPSISVTSGIGSFVSDVTSALPSVSLTSAISDVPAVPTVVPSISLTSKIGSIVSDVTSAVPSVPLTSDHSSATGIISGLPLPTNVTSVIASITSGVPITTGIISSEVASITSGPILSNVSSIISSVVSSVVSGIPSHIPSISALPTNDTLIIPRPSSILSSISAVPVVPSTAVKPSSTPTTTEKPPSTTYKPTTTPEPSTTLEITTKPTEITTSTTRPPIISASSGVAPTSIWFQTSTLVIAPPLATVTATSTASNLIATGTSTSGSVVAIPTALDPQLPKVITPAGGMPEAPADMVLVRLGFLHALNYQWVVSHSVSIAQIFQFLPQGLNYGLGVDSVTMHSLQPYDTRLTKGYITTLALAFIPSQLFDELDLQRRTPGSKLLNNPESSVHTLMGLLDPTIPLRASADEASGNANGQLAGGGSSWSDGTSNESNGSGSGSPIDNKSGSISTKTVGIGAGVVMGAFAYGGAMFFVARRYRQRRSRHSRTASIPGAMPPGGPAMAENSMTGAAMMQGARVTYGTYGTADRASKGSGGKVSARGPISGPVMAVNSLGWS